MTIPDTEPLKVLTTSDGETVIVPASTASGIKWSMRKWDLMQERGISSDDAEVIVRQEMAEAAKE